MVKSKWFYGLMIKWMKKNIKKGKEAKKKTKFLLFFILLLHT